MSKYAEKNLNNGERIVLKAKVNPLAAAPQAIWCVIVLVAAIVGNGKIGELGESGALDTSKMTGIIWGIWALIGALPLLMKIITLAGLSLAITNKRVIGKVGVLAVKTLDYPIDKVDNVAIEAGVLGNLFRYHKVAVRGGGGTDVQIKFVGIGNATKFKNAVTEAVEKRAEEARRAQAEEIARAMGR